MTSSKYIMLRKTVLLLQMLHKANGKTDIVALPIAVEVEGLTYSPAVLAHIVLRARWIADCKALLVGYRVKTVTDRWNLL